VTLAFSDKRFDEAIRLIIEKLYAGGYVLLDAARADSNRAPEHAFILTTRGAGRGAQPKADHAGPKANLSSTAAEYAPRELLLKFQPGTEKVVAQQIIQSTGGEVLDAGRLAELGYYRIRLPEGSEPLEVARTLLERTPVAVAEPNYIVQADAASLIAGDPLISQQWNLPAIDAPGAWELQLGSPEILVAVLDSGVEATHPELAGAVHDANGAPGLKLTDENGHGTAVSCIIAATLDGNGIAGVAPGISVLPVEVLDSNGQGTYLDVILGILRAIDEEARIINMSFGGDAFSIALGDAVQYAHEAGVLLVAAAGTGGAEQVTYPAAYPHVIGVSATNAQDQLSPFSNQGPHIDLAAPGEMILTCEPSGGYVWMSGTSASAPHVSGVLGLMLSSDPTIGATTSAQLLFGTARDLGEQGWDVQFGHGLVNALEALTAVEAFASR
jgi:subtilisin family serine protease